MGEFSLVSATGNMNLRVQVPALRFFLHQDCPRSPAAYPLEVLGRSCEEVYAPVSPVTLPGVPKLVALSGKIIISIILLYYVIYLIL